MPPPPAASNNYSTSMMQSISGMYDCMYREELEIKRDTEMRCCNVVYIYIFASRLSLSIDAECLEGKNIFYIPVR